VSGDKQLNISEALSKVAISAALSTPLMVLQMAFFQMISGDAQGLPTLRTMGACIIVYLALIYFQPL
jgi:hypothetical protein